MPLKFYSLIFALLTLLPVKAKTSNALMLFDPADSAAVARIKANDAILDYKTNTTPPTLHVTMGHAKSWPGIRLFPPTDVWNLSPYAYVETAWRNTSDAPVTLYCRVDNKGADGTNNCITTSLTLNPGQRGIIRTPLNRYSDDTIKDSLFGMNGYPKRLGGLYTIEPDRVIAILLFVRKPKVDQTFELLGLRATGTFEAPLAFSSDADPFIPFVDTFGQYRHKDWPGKTHSLEQLHDRRDLETAALKNKSNPKDWNSYGGWATGPKQKASGWFRVKKIKNRWWLVDPNGHLFFSQGIDCVRTNNFTPIEERETWFSDPLWENPDYASFTKKISAVRGHYTGNSPLSFNFSPVNLLRKYGPEWKSAYPAIVHQRLRAWGINTIGNWSDNNIRLISKTPYVGSINHWGAKMIEGSKSHWKPFPDVFDPSFKASLERSAQNSEKSAMGDPWCIGFFSDNELTWGGTELLALNTLASPAEQPAKRVFIADLEKKYTSIARLNETWGSNYSSWEDLATNESLPDKTKAGEDLRAFTRRIADAYFRQSRDVIRRFAPNQLYLGCRFSVSNPIVVASAVEHCDIVSYNVYKNDLTQLRLPKGLDKPILIGEFHFGALDRGLFHTGLVPTKNQKERANAYRKYVLSALHHPQVVGCHWFQYQDQALTGRSLDGENFQIGFVDIVDTPYPEMISTSRALADALYREANKASTP